MSNALMKTPSSGSSTDGILPAVASAIIPGLGQLMNKQTDKAIGMFAVVVGGFFLSSLPIVGSVTWLVAAGSWVYGIADAYITGKKKRV